MTTENYYYRNKRLFGVSPAYGGYAQGTEEVEFNDTKTIRLFSIHKIRKTYDLRGHKNTRIDLTLISTTKIETEEEDE